MDCPPRPGLHLIIELHDNGDGSAQVLNIAAVANSNLFSLCRSAGRSFTYSMARVNLRVVTILNLCPSMLTLCATGRWRLQLHRPPVDLHAMSTEMAKFPAAGHANLCVRLVDGRYKQRHDALDVDCNRHLYLPNSLIGADVVAQQRQKAKAAAAAAVPASTNAPVGHIRGAVPPPPDEPPPPLKNEIRT